MEDEEFFREIERRFTPAELVEFLDLSLEDIYDRFYNRITVDCFDDLCIEMGVELDDDNDQD